MTETSDSPDLSEKGWRAVSLSIWAGVIGVAVLSLALLAFSWRDLRALTLDLPDISLPEVSLPDLGNFRIEAEDPPTAKPGPVPDGMSPADDIPDAQPVNADRIADQG